MALNNWTIYLKRVRITPRHSVFFTVDRISEPDVYRDAKRRQVLIFGQFLVVALYLN